MNMMFWWQYWTFDSVLVEWQEKWHLWEVVVIILGTLSHLSDINWICMMRQKMREIFAMARCSDWADTPCIRLMHEQIAMVWCQSVMSLWDSKPIRRKLKMKQNAMHGGINVFLYSCWQIFHSLHPRRNVGSWWWDPLLWKLVAGDILRNIHN